MQTRQPLNFAACPLFTVEMFAPKRAASRGINITRWRTRGSFESSKARSPSWVGRLSDQWVKRVTHMVVAIEEQKVRSDMADLIVGDSPAMRDLRALIGRVGQSDASVLVTGPSGSGKELVARAIHEASRRSSQTFVALNCGAIPAELMESELFGHERGAFTGASQRRVGRFEEAHRGTLFLDEIGDMRFDMQVKLLRVLEDGLVQRVGGGAAIAADVRIVSATHQNIDTAIADGRFREDLYFRLGVVPIPVPSLAERVEDLPLLIAHFRKVRRSPLQARFDRSAMMRLMAHDWPGNVRELRNVVERADILFGGALLGEAEVEQLLGFRPGRTVRAIDLPQCVPDALIVPVAPRDADCGPQRRSDDGRSSDGVRSVVERPAGPIDLKLLIETLEQERIQIALEAADGIISEAARLLTLKRTTLIEKMRKYGVGKLAA